MRSAHAGEWAPVATGITYKLFNLQADRHSVALHAFQIDPRQVQIRPVFPGRNQYASKMRDDAGALIVSNANFFDPAGHPLGLVRISGHSLQHTKDISWWSVLCLQNDRARIVHSSRYVEGSCLHALQAGPRLVVANTIPKLKTESSRKTAIGIQPSGKFILVVTEREIPILDLAHLFATPERDGGLGCPEALNLDGGSSTQISVRAPHLRLDVAGLVRFPVGLGVFAK